MKTLSSDIFLPSAHTWKSLKEGVGFTSDALLKSADTIPRPDAARTLPDWNHFTVPLRTASFETTFLYLCGFPGRKARKIGKICIE
jgi:hypothetical protein